jgi:hypothetical protein
VCGSGEHLIAAGTAGQVSDCGVRGGDVGPEDRPEPPSQIVCECIATAADRHFGASVLRDVLRDIGHDLTLRVIRKKVFNHDVL